jgi:hypothetical protein
MIILGAKGTCFFIEFQLLGDVSIWPNVSPPRHADMLLVSIFQLFYKDPDLKHVGMTREGETAALPSSAFGREFPNSCFFLAKGVPCHQMIESIRI